MIDLFGRKLSRKAAAALVPDLTRVAGIRHFREENGPGAGQRIIRIESGGGLSVELLPDRTCDIGQVWLGATPFGWIGPIGTAESARLRGNQALSGLMNTCGFDHIRQPETDGDRSYPLHGSIPHQGATILAAEPVWDGDACAFRVTSETTQFSLKHGGMRLKRVIEVPLGGQSIKLVDEVTVLAAAQPLMAMYHFNLGFPLSGPGSVLLLNDEDLTAECLDSAGVRTRFSGASERAAARLASADGAAVFELGFDAEALPVFQTLRDPAPGINLTCLEPATHDRGTRAALRDNGTLIALPPGSTKRFTLDMQFCNHC